MQSQCRRFTRSLEYVERQFNKSFEMIHLLLLFSFVQLCRSLFVREKNILGLNLLNPLMMDLRPNFLLRSDRLEIENKQKNSITSFLFLESKEIQYGHYQSDFGAWWIAWRCFLEYGRNYIQSWKCHRSNTKKSHSKRWEFKDHSIVLVKRMNWFFFLSSWRF